MLTGSIWTYGKYNVTYGRIEVRMKTNNKVGNFPAAWLKWQPRNWTTDPYAEIDIVEMFGNMGSANHNIHSQLTVKNPKHGQKNSFRVPLDVKKWHVYAIEWTPTYVTWTIDGKPVGTYKKSTDPKLLREGQWTFDQPCYIVLNQSVGDGSIKGIGRYRNTTYETQFDYIRIYQKVKR
jgi:beta-glucanase (GH16 family)